MVNDYGKRFLPQNHLNFDKRKISFKGYVCCETIFFKTVALDV